MCFSKYDRRIYSGQSSFHLVLGSPSVFVFFVYLGVNTWEPLESPLLVIILSHVCIQVSFQQSINLGKKIQLLSNITFCFCAIVSTLLPLLTSLY